MKITDIMKASGMTMDQMAAKYAIPKRTLKSWIYGERKPTQYVLTMLTYIYMLEKEIELYGKGEERLASGIPEVTEGSKEARKES